MIAGKYVRRFWSRVEKTDGCWLWTAAKNGHGYGHMYVDGGVKQAHRIAFHIAHGRYPNGLTRHTCDNRPCVNPAHLLEGTARDNMHDAMERGRWLPYERKPRTHCPNGHEYTAETTSHVGAHRCKVCWRATLKRNYDRNREAEIARTGRVPRHWIRKQKEAQA